MLLKPKNHIYSQLILWIYLKYITILLQQILQSNLKMNFFFFNRKRILITKKELPFKKEKLEYVTSLNLQHSQFPEYCWMADFASSIIYIFLRGFLVLMYLIYEKSSKKKNWFNKYFPFHWNPWKATYFNTDFSQ